MHNVAKGEGVSPGPNNTMKKTRRLMQFAFLALTLGSVYLFGANAERWCPFGGVEALYSYYQEGNMLCSLGTSNFYILGGVILMTVLLRRAFCAIYVSDRNDLRVARAVGTKAGDPPDACSARARSSPGTAEVRRLGE